MRLVWIGLAHAAPCDPYLPVCLESNAPVEVRRAALAAADLRDPTVQGQLLRVLVDGPLHDDLVAALVRAGLVPASAPVPTRADVVRGLGRAGPKVGTCGLVVRDGRVDVVCRERVGCSGACDAHYAVATLSGSGPVVRSEEHVDDGSCGCCQLSE